MFRYTLALAGLSLAVPLTGLAAQAAGANPTAVLVGGPREGTKAPDFSLPWATKETVGTADAPYELWRDRGKTVVLAFYPADFTKGCTAELQTFADQYDTLFGSDVVVLGVSSDSLESHKRFAASLDLPFRLLSDPDLKVARNYASNGDAGRAKRTVFVIGPDGRVRYRNMKFNPLDPKDYSALGSAVQAARGG
ncbi:MAG TPA: peroxiredoxin [Gemmatimonadales bacterium]|nr:peroxiredoxin [Gemmatimonadales bacterium]